MASFDPTDILGAEFAAPPPDVGVDEAAAVAARLYGVSGRLTPLTSERDRNFLLAADDGRRLVLKFANPAEPAAAGELQTAVLAHVAARDPGLPVPRIVPTRDGAPDAVLRLAEGRDSRVRLLTYLDGTPLHLVPAGPGRIGAVAGCLARLAAALDGLVHPGAERRLVWDVAGADRLVGLLPAIDDPELRSLAAAVLDRFAAEVAPVLPRLRRQVVHNDFNPHNLLVDPAAPDRVAGVIDFGDAVATALVADVAVAASYHVGDADPVERIAAFAAAYHRVRPLAADELAVLADLVAARLVTTVAVTAVRAAREPGNATYILRNVPAARAGLTRLAAADRAAARARIARACTRE
ncbi:phosphotransferase [Oharaeibacter diazotrophicus]|uniref:Hydroxylysine kinase n=3 Tax=Oharaeibacter diazotrophicus TaxID=1920512 RepID=A0A4R6RIW5_9HYPH|nr:phosphotransferase [Oharaeibacter diazotrophicus]TDP86433.1 hypothetical protein EDD54_0307 [Oharaeibacter diazotrophicus]BBE71625.1 hypothetical protein OHA_1_01204 [Pleomorphomonas sp. SM30]GLS78388.1 aminotransferase [Oharaeibacter diazotrophicus]